MPRLARIAPPDRGIFTHEPIRVPENGLEAHRKVDFKCPRGHSFTITFAGGAELLASWECRWHSVPAGRIGVLHQPTPIVPRTHWDMLRQRRPEPELARLLDEQLKALRTGQLMPVDRWLHQMQKHRITKESR
jgi:RNA polymerase-binding protein